jgi:hypothetical protein
MFRICRGITLEEKEKALEENAETQTPRKIPMTNPIVVNIVYVL